MRARRALAVPILVAAALSLPARPAAGDGAVVLSGVAFQPSAVTVETGERVVWRHDDGSTLHTVTAADGSFDSHPTCRGPVLTSATCMSQGDEYRSPVFESTGTLAYFCKLHDGMQGTIRVVAPAQTTTAPPPPAASSTSSTSVTTTTTPSAVVAGPAGDRTPTDPTSPPRPGATGDATIELESAPPEGDEETGDASGAGLFGGESTGLGGLFFVLFAIAGAGAGLLWRFRPSRWSSAQDWKAGSAAGTNGRTGADTGEPARGGRGD
jgi:plastocyanin